mgnify:CR=1 FL=1
MAIGNIEPCFMPEMMYCPLCGGSNTTFTKPTRWGHCYDCRAGWKLAKVLEFQPWWLKERGKTGLQ